MQPADGTTLEYPLERLHRGRRRAEAPEISGIVLEVLVTVDSGW